MPPKALTPRRVMLAATAVALAAMVITASGRQTSGAWSPYVDSDGNINVPRDYRLWAFLGSWYVVAKGSNDTAGAPGFHTVYTQPRSVEHYLKTGTFPDGAVLVKELLKVGTGELTTGDARWPTDVEGWFVMVKDTQGRHAGNPLWGNGWGWAFFTVDDPNKTTTRNWRIECLGCHVPAKTTDWVYTHGYPLLQHPTRQVGLP